MCRFLRQSLVVACGNIASDDTVIHEVNRLQLFVDAACDLKRSIECVVAQHTV